MAEQTWRKPESAVALKMELDRRSITADGSDFTRVIVSAVDENGTVVPTYSNMIYLHVDGPARIIGGNRFALRKGKYAVLIASYYETGGVEIKAKAPGLTDAVTTLNLSKLEGSVYLPKVMPETPENKTEEALPDFVYLDNMNWLKASTGWNKVMRGRTPSNKPIELEGKTYKHGVTAHAPSEVTYELSGMYKTFSSLVSADPLTGSDSSLVFQIILDGKKAYDSGVMKQKSKPKEVEVSVQGVNEMKLILTDGGNGKTHDHGIWADAKLTFSDESKGQKSVEKNADPEPFELPAVTDTKPSSWVVSDIVMINGAKKSYPITVEGGEYQIYSDPWTSKKGTIIPGDAVKVRVRSSSKSGKSTSATLHIGDCNRQFKVTTE